MFQHRVPIWLNGLAEECRPEHSNDSHPEVTVAGKWPVEQCRAGQWIPQREWMLSRHCVVTLPHFLSKELLIWIERVHPSRQQSALVRGNQSWHSDAREKHLWLGRQKAQCHPSRPPPSRPSLLLKGTSKLSANSHYLPLSSRMQRPRLRRVYQPLLIHFICLSRCCEGFLSALRERQRQRKWITTIVKTTLLIPMEKQTS